MYKIILNVLITPTGGDINRSPSESMPCEPSTSNVSNQVADETPDLSEQFSLFEKILI